MHPRGPRRSDVFRHSPKQSSALRSKPVVPFEPLKSFTGNDEEPSREKTPASGAAMERSFRADVSNQPHDLGPPKQRRHENLGMCESSSCAVDMQGDG